MYFNAMRGCGHFTCWRLLTGLIFTFLMFSVTVLAEVQVGSTERQLIEEWGEPPAQLNRGEYTLMRYSNGTKVWVRNGRVERIVGLPPENSAEVPQTAPTPSGGTVRRYHEDAPIQTPRPAAPVVAQPPVQVQPSEPDEAPAPSVTVIPAPAEAPPPAEKAPAEHLSYSSEGGLGKPDVPQPQTAPEEDSPNPFEGALRDLSDANPQAQDFLEQLRGPQPYVDPRTNDGSDGGPIIDWSEDADDQFAAQNTSTQGFFFHLVLWIYWIASFVLGVWMLYTAFKVGMGWGMLVLLLPFSYILFLIMHWSDAKKPFLYSLACNGIFLPLLAVLALL